MLIQFSVSNFKTFKEKATLSLVASNYDKDTRENENITPDDKYNLRILKSAVIYGANASGKSKVLAAIASMKHLVLTSSKESQKGDEIDVDPFRLNVQSEKAPSEFEIIFTYKNMMYRYGFEANKKRITSEWLYYRPVNKEVELFYRENEEIKIHPRKFKKGATVVKEGLVRENALLLSVAAQFNDSISVDILEWFRSLKTISGILEEGYQGFTVSRTADSKYKGKILELLKVADLGIQDIKAETVDVEKLPNDMPKELKEFLIKRSKEDKEAVYYSDVATFHKRFDKSKKHHDNVNFSLDQDESAGTIKFFSLTGPILDSIENGYTLVIDELDSKLHPNLVLKIVALFNSKELNPKNAQLIFNTHNTNLLSEELFRRDQVWFTEKNKYGEAYLYSLADFKADEVRKREAFEENYVRGKYGAVPYLGLFDSLIHKNLMSRDGNQKQKD